MEKLFWIDLEMSGLNVETEVIIEVGAIVSDLNLNSLESYHAVVKQPQKYIDAMDDWNKKHHGESGLIALIPQGQEPAIVETALINLIDKHFAKSERPVIAGNSISQDRLFISKYMPKLDARLHYRMLDVTSWKILMNAKFNVKYEKKNSHRAVDDIIESMQELKAYLERVKP